jgi:hypothetical protein
MRLTRSLLCAQPPGLRALLILVSGFVLASFFGSPSSTFAVTHLVPNHFPTITAALNAANPGDDVLVSEAGSPYLEKITLPSDVRLIGGWDPTFTTQDPSRTVIELPSTIAGSVVGVGATTSSVRLVAFTIRGGNTANGGGIFCGAGSTLTIFNCIVENNRAFITGGGIQVASGSSVQIIDCVVRNNTALLRGGGIAVASGADNAAIIHCTVEACSTTTGAVDGGGGGISTSSSIRLERNKIRDNYSARNGGGLLVRNADIRGWANLLTANVAAFDGGGIYHESGSGLHTGTFVESCRAGVGVSGGNGGGVAFSGGTNRFHLGFVRYNEVENGDGFVTGLGGGLHFKEPLDGAAVRWTEIAGNEAPYGGGIGVEGTTPRSFSFLAIESNSIVGNASPEANSAAGGIHVRGQFVGSITNNVIAFQRSGYGVACSGTDASPTIRYNLVYNGSSNPAPEYGLNCADRTGVSGNIRANPKLCCDASCDLPGPPAPDLLLSSSSPCLGAGEGGVDLGAHSGASDCLSPIATEELSWGKIKARYR